MNFKFSLQRILNLREQETQEAELKVEKIRNVITELKKMVNHERDMYFHDREELNKNVIETQMNNVTLYEQSLLLRQERIMEILENIRTYQLDLEVYQQALIQSRRNQKILENLRDLKKKEFLEKQAAKEQAKIDEISTQRFIRGQMTEKGDE